MNKMKLIVSGAVLALSMVGLSGVVNAQDNAPECTIDPLPMNLWQKSFAKSESNIAGTFTLKGADNCKKAMTISVWNSPTPDGNNVDKQTLFSTKTAVFGKGTHSISTTIPPDGCYYQADLLKGDKATAPDGTANYAYQDGKILEVHPLHDATFGGTKKCEEKPPVTPPVTPKPPVKPETPVTPPVTKLPNSPVLVVPAEVAPDEQKSAPSEDLPSTGAGSIIAGTMGLSSSAGFAYSYAQSRRKKRMI